jgi:Flp pilus assembly pilin Flp
MTDAFVWAVVRLQNGYARLRDEERAQTLTEYALIIAVVALGVIIAIVFLRDQIRSLFNRAGSELSTQPGP